MEELKNYILENEDLLELVREVNSYDGSLDWLDYQENDEEFFNIYFSNPMEAVRAAHYGDYNYMDDFVKFDAYGNLESCSQYELEDELKDNIDEIINRLLELYNNLYISNELQEKIEEYEENEEEEE